MSQAISVKTEATRSAIIAATKTVLRERGYAGLSTRDVAAAAEVPLSQIHYHFGSKRGLILALFEHQNAELLERQHRLYDDVTLTLAEQWDRACDYLDEDLASGYVRVLLELWAAGWSDPEIALVVREGIIAWNRLLTDVARRTEDRYGPLAPFTANEVATLVGSAFIGAEAFLLLGFEQQGLPLRRSLRRFGDLIRHLETRSK
jgi:AcrR family transcriptional regulator